MTNLIPIPSSLITGSDFINKTNNNKIRESNILEACLNGNIPDFLRSFHPITVNKNNLEITYLVMKDYLSIGTNNDYIRMPMNPLTAQQIANKYDCSLPTRKMVNDIYANSNKLNAAPYGPPYDYTMESNERYIWSNNKINAELNKKYNNFDILIAGHKKDVVLTNRLAPNNINKKVAIYGWFLNNKVIQDLNPSSHDDHYADYSHGIRLIANDVIVNNNGAKSLQRLKDVFASSVLSSLVSDEGVLNFTSY